MDNSKADQSVKRRHPVKKTEDQDEIQKPKIYKGTVDSVGDKSGFVVVGHTFFKFTPDKIVGLKKNKPTDSLSRVHSGDQVEVAIFEGKITSVKIIFRSKPFQTLSHISPTKVPPKHPPVTATPSASVNPVMKEASTHHNLRFCWKPPPQSWSQPAEAFEVGSTRSTLRLSARTDDDSTLFRRPSLRTKLRLTPQTSTVPSHFVKLVHSEAAATARGNTAREHRQRPQPSEHRRTPPEEDAFYDDFNRNNLTTFHTFRPWRQDQCTSHDDFSEMSYLEFEGDMNNAFYDFHNDIQSSRWRRESGRRNALALIEKKKKKKDEEVVEDDPTFAHVTIINAPTYKCYN